MENPCRWTGIEPKFANLTMGIMNNFSKGWSATNKTVIDEMRRILYGDERKCCMKQEGRKSESESSSKFDNCRNKISVCDFG